MIVEIIVGWTVDVIQHAKIRSVWIGYLSSSICRKDGSLLQSV